MNINDIITESQHKCPHCGGPVFEYSELGEGKKDACYYKVKASAKVWPSAYASGRLVQCRKKGAANYGNKNESSLNEEETGNVDDADSWQSQQADARRAAETNKMSQQDAAAGGLAEGLAQAQLTPEVIQVVQDLRKAMKIPSELSAKKTMLVIKFTQQLDPEDKQIIKDTLAQAGIPFKTRENKVASVRGGEWINTLIGIPYDQPGVTEGIMSGPGTPQWAGSVAKAKTVNMTDTLWHTHQNVRSKHMAQLARDAGHTPTPSMISAEKRGIRDDEKRRLSKQPTQAVAENFADGRNPQDKGDAKRHGVPTKASVSTLRKVAKQGGRKGQLAHWMANMKAGRAKNEDVTKDGDPQLLFYAKLPEGTKVYARIKDAEQLADLQQQYRGAEIKTFDFRRADVQKWLEARRINLRKFTLGMVQTMYDVMEAAHTTNFNDDDWYEINPDTKTIVSQQGPQAYQVPFGQRQINLPNGNIVVRGMRAKGMGLDTGLGKPQQKEDGTWGAL